MSKLLRINLKLRNLARTILAKKHYTKLNFPNTLNIELTTICNSSCIICPHSSIKRKKIMDFNLFKKIIDEASKYDIKNIFPTLYGEPFLDNNLLKALRYIREKIPKSKIRLISNGSVMNDKQVDEVVKEHLIDNIDFSLDAINPETYNFVRKGLNYEITIKKIMNFLKKNKEYGNKIETTVSFTINDGNKKEIKKFRKFWKNQVSSIHFGADDGRKNNPVIDKFSNKPCLSIFESMFILSDGNVVLCCMDYNGNYSLGNVKEKSLKEIWDSEKYDYIRNCHLIKNKNKIPLCSKCHILG